MAVVPAGLPLGVYNLFVTNPDGDVFVLTDAFTVIGRGGVINSVQPAQGLAGFEVILNLYGSNFAEGASVQIGDATLPTIRISDMYLRATVPDTLLVGTYDVSVVNPGGGGATAVGAYTVLDLETSDDLYAVDSQIWVAPGSVRANAVGQIHLMVTRQGGKQPLPKVNVRFLVGASTIEAGGTLLGVGSITLLAPRTSANTTPVVWTPAAPGVYTLYAVIDPDNLVSESLESNNVVSRTLTVLPEASDQVAPRVDRFTINNGAESTSDLRIHLDTQASDPTPGSEIQSLLYQEFEFSQAANQWVPVRNSGWLDYANSHVNFGWDMLSSPGIKYLQAWAADRSGNISIFPFKASINYIPPTDRVGRNLAHSYRYSLQAGEKMVVTVTPISGDPDLYVWTPNLNAPPYMSNLSGAAVDAVTFIADADGEYQIEVYGYSAAEYQITIQVNATATSAQSSTPNTGNANLNKTPLTEPVLSRSSVPSDQQVLPTAPVQADAPSTPTQRNLYLPTILTP